MLVNITVDEIDQLKAGRALRTNHGLRASERSSHLVHEMPSNSAQPDQNGLENVTILFAYGTLTILAVTWLWNSGFYWGSFKSLGLDMVSIGPPLLLLWFSARRLTKGWKQCRVAAPYKFIVGIISVACALLSAIDFVKGPSARKLGAFLLCDMFVLISAVLFAFVMRAQTNALHKSDDSD